MRRHNDYDSGKKVYVGPYLDPGVTSDELRDFFGKYGSIQAVWVARNPPGFAFVTFDDAKDAEDACRSLDGTEFGGKRIRVEVAHGPRSNRPPADRNVQRFGRGRSRSSSPSYRRSPSYGASPSASSSGYHHHHNRGGGNRSPLTRNRYDSPDNRSRRYRETSYHGDKEQYSRYERRDRRSPSRGEIRRSSVVNEDKHRSRRTSLENVKRRRNDDDRSRSRNNSHNRRHESSSDRDNITAVHEDHLILNDDTASLSRRDHIIRSPSHNGRDNSQSPRDQENDDIRDISRMSQNRSHCRHRDDSSDRK